MKRNTAGCTGLACLVAVFLSGCVGMQSMNPPPDGAGVDSVGAPPNPTDELLALLDRIGRASPGELLREYETLAAAPEPVRGGNGQLRLALLLSQPGLPFRDDAAALRVLQAWENGQVHADPALKTFVHWLRAMLGERAKLAGGLEEAGAKLRDEKKRSEVCKDKLEAIKNMERSLIERDKH